MNNLLVVLFATICLFLSASFTEAEDLPFKEGKWSETITFDVPVDNVNQLPPQARTELDKMDPQTRAQVTQAMNQQLAEAQAHYHMHNGQMEMDINGQKVPVPATAGNLPQGDIDVRTNAKGMTSTLCVTKDHPLFNDKNAPPGCHNAAEQNGNVYSFHMECEGRLVGMKSNGQVTFTGDTFEGYTDSIRPGPNGEETHHKSHVTGKYLGPC